MERKQKTILAVIIAVILIIAVVLAVTFWPSEYNQVYKAQYDKCIQQNKETYLMLMAQRTGNEQYCEQKQSFKNKCLAYARKDPSAYCSELTEERLAVCQAEILQDSTKCPAEDKWCIAAASRNPQLCENLDEMDIQECKRMMPQNAEYWISAEAEKECREIATGAAESRMRLKSI